MKAADARAMTIDQIDDEVLKLKKEQFNLRFQRATGQLENTSRVREVRRDIARLKTIATQKRTGTMPQVAEKPAPAAKEPSRRSVKKSAEAKEKAKTKSATGKKPKAQAKTGKRAKAAPRSDKKSTKSKAKTK